MRLQSRFGILILLFLLGTPPTIYAQSHERFSVVPSNSGLLYGAGYIETEFTFTLDVTGATQYELDFGDRSQPVTDFSLDPAGIVTHSHRYGAIGNYVAKMNAWRNAVSEPIALEIEVRVQQRPSLPQAAPSHARFSVVPTEPQIYADVSFPGQDRDRLLTLELESQALGDIVVC